VLSRDVPCRNCLKSTCPQGHHECLRGVDAEAVARAAVELLAIGAAGPRSNLPAPRRRSDLPPELHSLELHS
jgi:hypothetical protein